jgi:hypothetical protein
MSPGRINRFLSMLMLTCLLFAAGISLLSGCSKSKNTFQPHWSGPQVIVNPDSIRMGVANVMGTNIEFEGWGFQPNDSVFISLRGPENNEVIVADARVKPNGTFNANISTLTKAMELLRSDVVFDTYSEDAKYSQVLVRQKDPIPPGVYKATATGLISNDMAETIITIGKPSTMDKFKDWIGVRLGKIRDNRS